ncbi:MAG: hypothetical protein BA861_09685 [Desulfobacterales bacterium S3730MH5]|nr:MAG: hypothetical protein BA861_09685 [Desulfobacterales bacterium S3730MH5]
MKKIGVCMMKKIGVCLLALALAVFFAAPAAAEFDLYGSLRLITGWYNMDAEECGPDGPGADYGVRDDNELFWELCDISRFGARFSTGDITANVELGLKGEGHGNNSVYTRLLYGTWDFGAGSLKVGQDYPSYTIPSSQVAPRYDLGPKGTEAGRSLDGENYFIGYGCLWESRVPQVELKLASGFFLTLLQPETRSDGDINRQLGVSDADVDKKVPKISVGYEYEGEGLCLSPGFAFNTYDVHVDSRDIDDRIDSYLIYLDGKAGLGPADIQWSLHYGQNLIDFGLWSRELAASAQFKDNGDVEDSQCYGGYLQVAFPVDPVTITVGTGYVASKNDALGKGDVDDQMSYFVQAKIPLANTFYIVPEFSYYDQMEDASGYDEPEAWFLGLMWRMDF